ncbi:MAG TPA: FHA domain-containing protein [Candidatus Krumholzibacteria bacterium]
MDQTTHAGPARIDDLIAAYRELQAQFDRARDRLRRADENRNTVQRRIYDRVRGEYDRELDAIRARMSPLRDEINRVHEALEAQCREAEAALHTVEEELAEAEFRHRTGEYETTNYNGMRLSLDARAEEARTRQALMRATLDALDGMRNTDEPAPPATDASPVSVAVAPEPLAVEPAPSVVLEPVVAVTSETDGVKEQAPSRFGGEPEFTGAELDLDHEAAVPKMDDILPHRPVLSAKRVAATAARPEGFENPHDWITEMAPDAARERRARAEESAVATATEPKPAPAPEATELANATPPSPAPAASFPSLVFVSGPHAGQSIALLPTSLTIGREHDNNIEIKDPDVARYHARILRQKDQYVVEDLNSSTGTWVNGERTQRAVLTHGDVIRLGQTELALDFEWTSASAD